MTENALVIATMKALRRSLTSEELATVRRVAALEDAVRERWVDYMLTAAALER